MVKGGKKEIGVKKKKGRYNNGEIRKQKNKDRRKIGNKLGGKIEGS